MVGPNKQTSIHVDTHTRVQCSHTSVGLAQARPNKIAHIIGKELVANHMLKMHKYPSKLNHIVWNSHLNSLSFTIHEFAISAHTYSYRVFQSTPNSIAIAMPITPNNLRGSNFQKFRGGAEILKEVPSCSVHAANFWGNFTAFSKHFLLFNFLAVSGVARPWTMLRAMGTHSCVENACAKWRSD